jgi:Transglycosylase SLT domain
MVRLTMKQLMALWIKADGTPGWAPLMAGIAYAESGGTPGAVQKTQPPATTGWGLWQITPGTEKMLTPLANAQTAVGKFSVQGLTAWYDDRVWTIWKRNGSPIHPSAETVREWILEMTQLFEPYLTLAPTPPAPEKETTTMKYFRVTYANGEWIVGIGPSVWKLHIASKEDEVLYTKLAATPLALSTTMMQTIPTVQVPTT